MPLDRATHCCELDPDIAVAPLVKEMREYEVPIEVVDVDANGSHTPYDRKLIIVRTDQHVAWRGDAIPDQPEKLVGILTGRANEGGAE